MSCVGTSSGGSVTSLMALGAMDVYLTQCPQVTMWRFRYNKYTNFAMESIIQPFNTATSFGTAMQANVNRNGDLLYYTYVVFDLPGIVAQNQANHFLDSAGNVCQASCAPCAPQFPSCDPCDPCGDGPEPDIACPPVSSSVPQEDTLLLDDVDICTGVNKPWAHWVNAIGQYLVGQACFSVGGQQIESIYNDFLFMWEELAGQPGKQLTEMIGKRNTRAMLIEESKRDRTLYVPLFFSYTSTPGNAFSLISSQFHGVQINVSVSRLDRAIQTSGPNVKVVRSSTCGCVDTTLSAYLDLTYILLDEQERNRFAAGCMEQLYVQKQHSYQNIGSGASKITLNFNHPVIELIWAIRRKCNSLCGNHFNFAGKWGRDPALSFCLELNNQSRFSREARYFRLVQPYQHHTLIPQGFIYCYSFAINAEDAQPNGSTNFSRIDNATFNVVIDPLLNDNGGYEMIVWARNYNVLRYKNGLTGLAFQS